MDVRSGGRQRRPGDHRSSARCGPPSRVLVLSAVPRADAGHRAAGSQPDLHHGVAFVSSPRPREDERKTYERPHVLIVTDDPSLTEFLGEGLVMGGFWTSVISHGLQVLEVFRLRTFDLIVVDRDLGTFDAIELIERL